MTMLSVVMPVHNAARTLPEALESVLGQSLRDIELICVDDGSTDDSLAILRAYEARDPRVRVIAQENRHAGVARNRGLEAARGDYVHFLDADDSVLPYAYEALCDKVVKHDLDLIKFPSVDWDVQRACYVNDPPNSFSGLRPGAFNRLVGCEPSSPIHKVSVTPWTGIYRRSFLMERDIRFDDLVCVNDHGFHFAVITNARRMMIARDRLVFHRVGQEGSLVGRRAQHFDCHFRSIEIVAERLAADQVDREVQETILNRKFRDLFAWYKLFCDGSELGCDIARQTARFVESYRGPFASSLQAKHRDTVRKFADGARPTIKPLAEATVRHEACERPKVSVVVPVHNAEDVLSETLHDLTAQTLEDMEFLLVDDGSTDGSMVIMREYAALDGRFRVFDGPDGPGEPNGGSGRAMNRGIDAARGEYLSFLDVDDLIEPDAYSRACVRAQEGDLDVVVFRGDEYVQATGALREALWTLDAAQLPDVRPFAGEDIPDPALNALTEWTGDKLFRTELVRGLDLRFQEQRTEDDLLFTYSALLRARRIDMMDDVLVHRRVPEGSLPAACEQDWGCFYQALVALRARLVAWGLYERRERGFVNCCLHLSLRHLNSLTGEAYRALYAKLRDEWLADLGVLSHGRDYFLDAGEYEQLEALQRSTADEFLFWRLGRACEGRDELQRRLGQTDAQIEGQKRQIERLSEENNRLRADAAAQRADAAAQRAEVARLRGSTTWKVGRVVTWPARKLKRLAKRLKMEE